MAQQRMDTVNEKKSMQEILELGQSLSEEDYAVLNTTARAVAPQVILEIGSRYGTSSMLFAEILKETGGELICIEPEPQPVWFKNMSGFKNYRIIRSYSPWVDIRDVPAAIDYLFIDGDHRTRFAICDYHFFAPFVRVGGRIAFHDTLLEQDNVGFMVTRAINIILEESDNLKFVAEAKGVNGMKVFEKTKDF